MKIELNRPALDAVISSQGSPAEATGNSALHVPEEDQATLSTDKATVDGLAVKVLNAPEIRQDKVEALQQAIKSGQYQIEPDAIAEGVIRDSE